MATLYKVDSPITREQRNNINATFEDIQRRLSNLRLQISILSGGADLEEIIQRIENTITNSENSIANVEQALLQLQNGLNELNTAISNSETATQSANDAVVNAQTEINNLQSLINNLGNAETFNVASTYQKNNIVEYNGSSFIALQTSTGNLPPNLPLKRNEYWQLLAQRGIDGTGSVSSVNSISPDVNGNIKIDFSNVGAVSQEDFDVLNNLTTKIISSDSVNVKNPPIPLVPAVGDGVTDDTQALRAIFNYCRDNFKNVYFPAGTYLTDTLDYGSLPYAQQFSIHGNSRTNTIIQKRSADGLPLLKIGDEEATNFTSSIIVKGINFRGIQGDTSSVVELWDLVRSKISDCTIERGINGLVFYGGIACVVDNCICANSVNGLRLRNFTSLAGGGFPNLINITNSQLVDNTSWGLNFDGGRFINVYGCDIEGNGTDGTVSGGVNVGLNVNIENTSGLKSVGINLDNNWFEANKGRTSVLMQSGENKIINSYFVANSATYDVLIVGGSYTLRDLKGDNPKEPNVFEDVGVTTGNFIDNCSFSNYTINAEKTAVLNSTGRLITTKGEVATTNVINPHFQFGRENQSGTVVDVTFPRPFADIPFIFTQNINNNPASVNSIEVYNVTINGFTARKKAIIATGGPITTENVGFHWVAMGQYA